MIWRMVDVADIAFDEAFDEDTFVFSGRIRRPE
jgi:hypothetical protein